MKNYTFSLLLFLIFTSCTYLITGNDKDLEQQRKRIYLDSLYLLYDSMPAPFDIKSFKENHTGRFYLHVYEDSFLIKYQQIRNDFIKEISHRKSTLVERSFYNSEGVIQKKYHTFYRGMGIPYGKKFEYDKNGKLINVTDRFPEFNFTFDDLVLTLDSLELYNCYITYSVDDEIEPDKVYWVIEPYNPIKWEGWYRYLFDTETGEFFEQ